MNAEVKELWLKALRSGDYPQAKNAMRDINTGGFCCLGVLCDISRKGEWQGTAYRASEDEPLCAGSFLSETIREWASLEHYESVNLAHMNDRGVPFEVIADVIERTL